MGSQRCRGHRTERDKPGTGLEGLPLGTQRQCSGDQDQRLYLDRSPNSIRLLTSLIPKAMCPSARFLMLSWTSSHSMGSHAAGMSACHAGSDCER